MSRVLRAASTMREGSATVKAMNSPDHDIATVNKAAECPPLGA